MTNQEQINSLTERDYHSDTMRPLSLLERIWLYDAEKLFNGMTLEEQRAWLQAEYF